MAEKVNQNKLAFISGPRDREAYSEAGKYLETMGYLPLNIYQTEYYDEGTENREMRLAAARGADLLFLLPGWEKNTYAVDEWEAVVFFNKESNAGIGISYPYFRG